MKSRQEHQADIRLPETIHRTATKALAADRV